MTTKCVWVTDIHLNFITDSDVHFFGQKLAISGADSVLITGDISEAPALRGHLELLQKSFGGPIYFILGNHDYYHSNLGKVRAEMRNLTENSNRQLNWMPARGQVSLSEDTALIGHDGWYDCAAGDWTRSGFLMSDWSYIEDFRNFMFYLPPIVAKCREIAEHETRCMESQLRQALDNHINVIALTHIPPFPKSSQHMGKQSDDAHIPFYCSLVMGNMFLNVMKEHPDKTLTIFAGHTHSPSHFRAAKNIECFVSGAEYGYPTIAQVITVK